MRGRHHLNRWKPLCFRGIRELSGHRHPRIRRVVPVSISADEAPAGPSRHRERAAVKPAS